MISHRLINTPYNKAAGSAVTATYPYWYVARRHTTENAVRWRFHRPAKR